MRLPGWPIFSVAAPPEGRSRTSLVVDLNLPSELVLDLPEVDQEPPEVDQEPREVDQEPRG